MADDGSTDSSATTFVADLHHLPLITRMLSTAAIPLIATEPDEGLGLALLTLGPTDDGRLEADTVLGFLRQRSAADRDGWMPTIGRNRDAGDGIAIESHKVMDAGAPMLPGGGIRILSHKVMNLTLPSAVEPGAAAPPAADAHLGSGIRIGILDTSAPDPAELVPSFRAGHGMFVRSVIARQAPAIDLVSVGVMDPHTGRRDTWTVAKAIVALANSANPPDILNLSLGCFTYAGGPPLLISRAISRIVDRVVVVAAAGNNGQFDSLVRGRDHRSISWPAGMPEVISVGSVDRDGVRPDWSPAGSWVRCTALGVDVVGDFLDGPVAMPDQTIASFAGKARWSGTSFSAAIVSGAIAAEASRRNTTARAAAELLVPAAASDTQHVGGA